MFILCYNILYLCFVVDCVIIDLVIMVSLGFVFCFSLFFHFFIGTSHEIVWEERPRNDLFCAERDVKHLLNESTNQPVKTCLFGYVSGEVNMMIQRCHKPVCRSKSHIRCCD